MSLQRRQFVSLLGTSASAWPSAAAAQQPALPAIGWLSGRGAQADAAVLPVFRRGLAVHGYIENRNVEIEYRYADGQFGRIPALAAQLLQQPKGLVVVIGAGMAATRAVREIQA